MMQRPLDRRMFANSQQRRNMARMPQGILASGPRIMQAAMQQEPVRMSNGFVDNYWMVRVPNRLTIRCFIGESRISRKA